MIRFIAVIFALAVATSAQAMSHTRAASSAGWHATVHQACGAGMHYLNGRCVTTAARRNVRSIDELRAEKAALKQAV